MADELYTGDVIKGRFRVTDPDTGELADLPEPPSYFVRYPGGESEPQQAAEGEGDLTGWWLFTYRTTTHGTHIVFADAPDPYDKTEVATVYVNPLPAPLTV